MNIGDKSDHLTLIKFVEPYSKAKMGLFECVCGNRVTRTIHGMRKKTVNPRSCGCIPQKPSGGGKREAVRVDNGLARGILSVKW